MKVAVSIPDSIFKAAERLARERNLPRSQVFAEALSAYLEEHGSEAITAALDEVYAKQSSGLAPALERAQFKSLDHETW